MFSVERRVSWGVFISGGHVWEKCMLEFFINGWGNLTYMYMPVYERKKKVTLMVDYQKGGF